MSHNHVYSFFLLFSFPCFRKVLCFADSCSSVSKAINIASTGTSWRRHWCSRLGGYRGTLLTQFTCDPTEYVSLGDGARGAGLSLILKGVSWRDPSPALSKHFLEVDCP